MNKRYDEYYGNFSGRGFGSYAIIAIPAIIAFVGLVILVVQLVFFGVTQGSVNNLKKQLESNNAALQNIDTTNYNFAVDRLNTLYTRQALTTLTSKYRQYIVEINGVTVEKSSVLVPTGECTLTLTEYSYPSAFPKDIELLGSLTADDSLTLSLQNFITIDGVSAEITKVENKTVATYKIPGKRGQKVLAYIAPVLASRVDINSNVISINFK
jgi:hypothetical protein